MCLKERYCYFEELSVVEIGVMFDQEEIIIVKGLKAISLNYQAKACSKEPDSNSWFIGYFATTKSSITGLILIQSRIANN
jgi:hypothetical protein